MRVVFECDPSEAPAVEAHRHELWVAIGNVLKNSDGVRPIVVVDIMQREERRRRGR